MRKRRLSEGSDYSHRSMPFTTADKRSLPLPRKRRSCRILAGREPALRLKVNSATTSDKGAPDNGTQAKGSSMIWTPNRIQTSLVSMLGALLVVSAQPPQNPAPIGMPPLSLPATKSPDASATADGPSQPDPESESVIRSALRGEMKEAPDPLLGGVLDAIRSQGSVLDGSSLDNRIADPGLDRKRPVRTRDSDEGPTAKHARLAEQMLRVARMLEREVPREQSAQTDPDNDEMRFLINRLRHHAGRFLIQSVPAGPSDAPSQ